MTIPAPETVGDDTPLRLAVAAAIAFPDGSMTERGLRREVARGRLAIERVAGKDYTTSPTSGPCENNAASSQARPTLAPARTPKQGRRDRRATRLGHPSPRKKA